MVHHDIYTKLLLWAHIFCGGLGLMAGSVNLLRIKGDKIHKLVGTVFLYAMLAASFLALILSVVDNIPYLFAIGIFTIYLAGTGQRYLHLKNLATGQKPAWIDYALTYLMLAFAFAMAGGGIYLLVKGKIFGAVLCFFAAIGTNMVRRDFMNYTGKVTAKNFWLLNHLGRMTGAYIASFTAFLLNTNLLSAFGIAGWLLPSFVLIPVIVIWVRKFKVSVD